VVRQQYAPDPVVGRDYYAPSDHGAEQGAADRVAHLRAVLRGAVGGAQGGTEATDATADWRPRCDPEVPTAGDRTELGDPNAGNDP
jgi:hypothetical protein